MVCGFLAIVANCFVVSCIDVLTSGGVSEVDLCESNGGSNGPLEIPTNGCKHLKNSTARNISHTSTSHIFMLYQLSICTESK